MNRPSWAQYALLIAEAVSQRSEDPYVKVGACILGKTNEVLATGYNGPPAGVTMDMSDRDARRPYMLHAESNAMRYIRPGDASILATTLMPCIECLKLAKSYGIDTIVYRDGLPEHYDPMKVVGMAFGFGVQLIGLGVN